MSGAPFVVREYVRWGDVDPEGIIRYDAYTRFMEMAEGDFFRALGLSYSDVFRRYGIGIPRRVMHMEFLSSPVLDEELEVRVYVSHVGDVAEDELRFLRHGRRVSRGRAPGHRVRRPPRRQKEASLAPGTAGATIALSTGGRKHAAIDIGVGTRGCGVVIALHAGDGAPADAACHPVGVTRA